MVRVHKGWEDVSWILILFLFKLYSGVFQQSSASSAKFFNETSEGESPQETHCKQCKTSLTNSAWSVCLLNLRKVTYDSRSPEDTVSQRIFLTLSKLWFFLIRFFVVIHLLSQEQAFGVMTYSLKRALGDSLRHRDNKVLSRKFRGEN